MVLVFLQLYKSIKGTDIQKTPRSFKQVKLSYKNL